VDEFWCGKAHFDDWRLVGKEIAPFNGLVGMDERAVAFSFRIE